MHAHLRPRCNCDHAANAVFEVGIHPYLCNVDGTLHGGAASTILDNLPGEALHVAAQKGWIDYGSVSRTLTVVFEADGDGEEGERWGGDGAGGEDDGECERGD